MLAVLPVDPLSLRVIMYLFPCSSSEINAHKLKHMYETLDVEADPVLLLTRVHCTTHVL
jgi:hypothetical protein